jgi:hypothetical protein
MINTEKRQAVTYFVGYEVEHTICYQKRTLFVVGVQPIEEILTHALYHKCDHIYFGTSQSFNPTDYKPWDEMILGILKKDFWVTLDFDVKYVEGVHESGYCEFTKFVPMISVKLPYINQFNYNATLKLDDTTWGKSNPGVWCHNLTELLKLEKYTNWDQYNQDTPINV